MMDREGMVFGKSADRSCPRSLPAILLVVAVLCLHRPAAAAITSAGSIKLAEGITLDQTVKIVRSGYENIVEGMPGDSVFIGDTVKTGESVKVRLELRDGTVVTAAPNAVVQITALEMDRTALRRKIDLKVLKGTARCAVSPVIRDGSAAAARQWKDSMITIDGISAIATVRRSDVVMTVSPGEVEIAVLDGEVTVRSAGPGSKGEVVVREGQVSLTGKSGIPSLAPLSAERRELLANRTALEKGVASAADLPRRTKPTRPYTENDVARDVAAGMTISDVMDKAVEHGMAPEAAVSALIKAGVGADAVVYTAVQEGYSPAKVVEAAIVRGAPATPVFSAALSAGAERQAVMDGARAAGMPPTAIAGSMASATSSALGKPGTTGTEGAVSPLAIIPQAGIPIGGGGGAPPSSEPASPYRP